MYFVHRSAKDFLLGNISDQKASEASQKTFSFSAKDGCLRDIQGLATNLMDFLTDEELTEAEQLYVLVALLRSAKVAQCMLTGSNMTDMWHILRKDVQAHLV